MAYYDLQQPQAAWSNPLTGGMLNPQFHSQAMQSPGQAFAGAPMQGSGGFGSSLGQAAYGQPLGQFGYGQQPHVGAFGQAAGWGAHSAFQPSLFQPVSFQSSWGQRQLSPQDVGEVVRQIAPILPQIIAQAQQPQGIGSAAYGLPQRQLTPQDVNEVARHLLPLVPQIVGALQGQPQLQQAAMYGGLGASGQFGQPGFGQNSNQLGGPFQINQPWQQQQPFGQFAGPYAQAAFGGPASWSTPWGQPQRQLTQQDAAEVARQLVGLIPQVIGNLQAFNQPRMI